MKTIQTLSFLTLLISATGDDWSNLLVVFISLFFLIASTYKLKNHV